MKRTSVWLPMCLTAACSSEPDIDSFVMNCPGANGRMGQSTICTGGDPGLVRQIPDIGVLPRGVTLKSTTLTQEGDQKGVGYAAEFSGSLDNLKPAYDAIISKNPRLSGHYQGSQNLFVIGVDGGAGEFISLTAGGPSRVEILAWRIYP